MTDLETVWRINCEWDIGHDKDVYATYELAEQTARELLSGCGIDETIEELMDQGLLSFEELEVIS